MELSKSLLEGRSRHPRLRDLEHEADDVAHDIYRLVNKTFVTPIEREDILALASALDDIVDLAEEVSDKIDLYHVKEISEAARRMGENLAKAGDVLARALEDLEGFRELEPRRIEIHRLENETDQLTREALATLFTEETRPPTWSSGRTSTTCSKPPWTAARPRPTSSRRWRSRMLEGLLVATIVVAVAFDFTNGFHDTANAIATSISTRAMSAGQAVALSSVFNLLGALVTVLVLHSKVANTIASTLSFKAGMVVVIAALLGAIVWNLVTWFFGLPSSSTHAVIGGLVGAGVASVGSFSAVKWASFTKQLTSLVISPMLGFVIAAVLVTLIILAVHRLRPGPVNRTFRLVQIAAAAFVSFSHGGNDAQKTMAAITLGLVASGQITKFEVPVWVVVLSATAIAFGTYAGGWRIIRTLGWRIYKMDPVGGLAAQLTGATVIQVASQIGLPVSTTHVITGSVMGSGAARSLSALRWGSASTSSSPGWSRSRRRRRSPG